VRAAQALKFLLLQYAKKFGLQCQGNIADLIQEECALVGQFETANLLRDRASKSAPLMAKKFAFQQIERNRSAIQFYVGASAARADIVTRARSVPYRFRFHPAAEPWHPLAPRVRHVRAPLLEQGYCLSAARIYVDYAADQTRLSLMLP
jgi:hypothetical protein